MTERPQALFLAHRIPYPPDKGDKIRSWRLLSHLAERYRVHLVCFADDAEDFQHQEFLASRLESVHIAPLKPATARLKSARGFMSGRPLSVEYFFDGRVKKIVDNLRALPLNLEVVFSSAMAQYVEAPIGDRPRIIDFCDADSEKFVEYAESATWPMSGIYAREGRLLAALETEIANWADHSFAITPDEAAIFNNRPALNRPVDWWSNGVDTDYFDADTVNAKADHEKDIVFVGAMDYRANVEAVESFVASTWPLVRKSAPDATFAIVGRNPTRSVMRLNDVDGVIVTGAVDDVRPWVKGAKIAIAPLRVARGIQNKVLEAMAMAAPVVATPQAMTGIEHDEEAVCICSEPSQMSEAILALLAMPERRSRMGTLARQSVLRRYSWSACLNRFDTALAHVSRDYSSSSPPGAP